MKVINGESIPNLPWEDKPSDCKDVIWRSKNNPIITRDFIKNSNSIFNSAVVPFEGGFRGVFRSDDTTRRQTLHAGKSSDGIHWEIADEPIRFSCSIDEIKEFCYGYDPRVCKIEDKYYVILKTLYTGKYVDAKMLKLYEHEFESIIINLLKNKLIEKTCYINKYGTNPYILTMDGISVIKRKKIKAIETIKKIIYCSTILIQQAYSSKL